MLNIEKEKVRNEMPFLKSIEFDSIEEIKLNKMIPERNTQFLNRIYTGSMGNSELVDSCFLLSREGNLLYKLKSGELFHSNYAYVEGRNKKGEYLLDALNDHRDTTYYIVNVISSYSNWGDYTDHDWQTVVKYCVVDWDYINMIASLQ